MLPKHALSILQSAIVMSFTLTPSGLHLGIMKSLGNEGQTTWPEPCFNRPPLAPVLVLSALLNEVSTLHYPSSFVAFWTAQQGGGDSGKGFRNGNPWHPP